MPSRGALRGSPTPSSPPTHKGPRICASPPGTEIKGTKCKDTGKTSYVNPNGPPRWMSEDAPSCIVTSSDDACASCAKSSCCAAYEACSSEVGCSCLVGCLHQGSSVETCTTADNCGSPSAASIAMAACLESACPGTCASVGNMGSAMCPSDVGAGGAAPACSAAGETCEVSAECCPPLVCALNTCD